MFLSSQPPSGETAKHLPDALASLSSISASAPGAAFDDVQDSQVFFFQGLEVLVQLLMPWVQDADLEAQCRGGNEEVRDGNCAGDEHLVWLGG